MNKEWNKIVKWSILLMIAILFLGLSSCEVEEYEPSPFRVAMMDLNKAKSKWRVSEIKHHMPILINFIKKMNHKGYSYSFVFHSTVHNKEFVSNFTF